MTIRKAAENGIEALDSLWAAIGDALCSGTGIDKSYAWAVQARIIAAKDDLRAALAEPELGVKDMANRATRDVLITCDSEYIGEIEESGIYHPILSALQSAVEVQREILEYEGIPWLNTPEQFVRNLHSLPDNAKCRAIEDRDGAISEMTIRALKNCRALAARECSRAKTPEGKAAWQHILRFCKAGGVEGSVLRKKEQP